MNEPFEQRGAWIEDVSAMDPFFMAIVSGGDRWMYLASTGGLTCGRRDPSGALFSYETDDRLCASDGSVGPRTVVFVGDGANGKRWEPFLRAADGAWPVRRRLWKSSLGDAVRFEERNEAFGLVFRYSWRSGDRFGFVREVELVNEGNAAARIRILDGLLGVLPACVDRTMQAGYSNLVDAYKQSELLGDPRLALYRLSSIPTDRAIPNEALQANVAWERGLPNPTTLLSARQLQAFRRGARVTEERATRGQAGALLVASEFDLAPSQSRSWRFGLDARLDAAAVVSLRRALASAEAGGTSSLLAQIASDQDADRERLLSHVAAADGLQATAEPREDARHAANAMFNAMRGGTFLHDGRIDAADFARYLREVAPRVAERTDLASFAAASTRQELTRVAQSSGDADLERLAREYLPLTFSRRHGDPSRPWNVFTIDTHGENGEPRLRYEGNWRDIFQNWEALMHSYPVYAEAAVCKFVDATTRDGHNPYRVTREGFDWERPDPSDPWAHIGYWGDHQVSYLQRLLDLCESHDPGSLSELLRRPLFVFADVPYRIAPYERLLQDPHETIAFDRARDAEIQGRAKTDGNEARLLRDARAGRASPLRVGLFEKLLVPLLAKLGNFVPGLGVWMNTQRPEWNDANNALVGRGVSVVTAAQLLRHCASIRRIVDGAGSAPLPVTMPVVDFARDVAAALSHMAQDASPRQALDRLGMAASRYRERVYADAARDCESAPMRVEDALALLDAASAQLRATLRANRREDGLFHSYNLLSFASNGEVLVRRLQPMLEGQVAALQSFALTSSECADLLDALRRSPLRREDLGTYLLYPDRELAAFLDKGLVHADVVAKCPSLVRMLEQRDGRIVRRDMDGAVRFAPSLHNADALRSLCERTGIARDEAEEIERAYEQSFDHSAFTGRSGSFFGFEGLGCVYWHMVSKLRLAVAEAWERATKANEPSSTRSRLLAHYEDVRAGLGCGLEPSQYGAFPSDPYSHTPKHAGARQPGMTGQVKEDLISRRLELGFHVEHGCLRLGSAMRESAPLKARAVLRVGNARGFEAEAGTVAASICGVPVSIRSGVRARIQAFLRDGSVATADDGALDRALSRALFARDGSILKLEAEIPRT